MRRKDRKVTELTEIESIIQKADVCRIALIDDNLPYIVTLNFGYKSGKNPALYFHCANEGRKIEKVTSKVEKIEGLNYIMKQYSGKDQFDYEDKMLDITTILKLEIDSVTGKQKV